MAGHVGAAGFEQDGTHRIFDHDAANATVREKHVTFAGDQARVRRGQPRHLALDAIKAMIKS